MSEPIKNARDPWLRRPQGPPHDASSVPSTNRPAPTLRGLAGHPCASSRVLLRTPQENVILLLRAHGLVVLLIAGIWHVVDHYSVAGRMVSRWVQIPSTVREALEWLGYGGEP